MPNFPQNEYVNKVVYGSDTLIDLSNDDVTASDVLIGKLFHLPSGAPASGSCTFDADTKDATAVAAEILSGKTAYKNGSKITGTMANIGAQNSAISSKTQQISISQGYHDGSGKVSIAAAEQSKLIPDNIREGITILGIVGTMSGSEDVKATSLSATPYITSKAYLPAGQGDYNYFSEITVASIYYNEQQNATGGYTVTIGTVDSNA